MKAMISGYEATRDSFFSFFFLVPEKASRLWLWVGLAAGCALVGTSVIITTVIYRRKKGAEYCAFGKLSYLDCTEVSGVRQRDTAGRTFSKMSHSKRIFMEI